MRCGLYGKLPAKRDFIALYAPRAFLGVWESWMAGAVAASRQKLGDTWHQAYLTAPIWRFWLGAEICGTTVAGAYMPSLDGVGRYFPLTLFACADEDASIPPPELNAQDQWFDLAEALLLSALQQETSFEAVVAGLEGLPVPSDRMASAAEGPGLFRASGMLAVPAVREAWDDAFRTLRIAGGGEIYSAATFWWTIGGQDYEPLAVAGRGMPDPFLFADMLTGSLATQAAFAAER